MKSFQAKFTKQNSKYPLFLALCCVLAACAAPPMAPQAPYREGAQAQIFLQPLPQQARGLRFIVSGLRAVPRTGEALAMSVHTPEVVGKDRSGRQRFFADAILPAGEYIGLQLQLSAVWLLGEEGEEPVPAPTDPIFLPLPFTARKGEGLALFLELEAAAVQQGSRFRPLFTLRPPRRELAGLSGYLTGSSSGLAHVFHKGDLLMLNLMPVGGAAAGMALHPNRERGFIADAADPAVAVFDLLERRLLWRIPLRPGDEPQGLGLTPDGRLLVSANRGLQTISLIDTEALIERERLRVGPGPTEVVVDAAGRRAYVVCTDAGEIAVVDLLRQALAAVVPLQALPSQAALSREGDRLLVAGSFPALTIIDTRELRIVSTLHLGGGGSAVTVDQKSGLIYLGLAETPAVAVIDPFSLSEVDWIPLAGPPLRLALDREENDLLALVPRRGLLQKVHLSARRVATEMEVPKDARFVTVAGER